jgi:hypothetical protein
VNTRVKQLEQRCFRGTVLTPGANSKNNSVKVVFTPKFNIPHHFRSSTAVGTTALKFGFGNSKNYDSSLMLDQAGSTGQFATGVLLFPDTAHRSTASDITR